MSLKIFYHCDVTPLGFFKEKHVIIGASSVWNLIPLQFGQEYYIE